MMRGLNAILYKCGSDYTHAAAVRHRRVIANIAQPARGSRPGQRAANPRPVNLGPPPLRECRAVERHWGNSSIRDRRSFCGRPRGMPFLSRMSRRPRSRAGLDLLSVKRRRCIIRAAVMSRSSAPAAPSICSPKKKKSLTFAPGSSAIAGGTKRRRRPTSGYWRSGLAGPQDIVTRAALLQRPGNSIAPYHTAERPATSIRVPLNSPFTRLVSSKLSADLRRRPII